MGPLEKVDFLKKLYLIINVLQVEDWQFWTFPSGLNNSRKRWKREMALSSQQKVYLHLDNTGYFENETMWFKAYVTRTDNGRGTDLLMMTQGWRRYDWNLMAGRTALKKTPQFVSSFTAIVPRMYLASERARF